MLRLDFAFATALCCALIACGGPLDEGPLVEVQEELRPGRRPTTQPRGCGARLGDTCLRGEYCHFEPTATCGWADAPGVCRTQPNACYKILRPVCGCDGQTHDNDCFAHRAGTSVLHNGACVTPPTLCGARLGDTCETDQYCDFTDSAGCGRTDIPGTCEARPIHCTREYRPVCGCDGRTYSNGCTAASQGVDVLHSGRCRVRPQPRRATLRRGG